MFLAILLFVVYFGGMLFVFFDQRKVQMEERRQRRAIARMKAGREFLERMRQKHHRHVHVRHRPGMFSM
jgi:hypothetical protein